MERVYTVQGKETARIGRTNCIFELVLLAFLENKRSAVPKKKCINTQQVVERW